MPKAREKIITPFQWILTLTLLAMSHWLGAQGILDDPRLFEPGVRQVYSGERLEAISLPLGGIGSGNIQINGKAELSTWQIFNNFTQATVPNSFFGIYAKSPGQVAIVRALQTVPKGPFPGMEELTFSGEYPFGWYEFKDDSLPVSVKMEVFSPLIPLQARESAIPCAIFSVTATNNTAEAVEVSFLATQKNAVGYKADVLIGEMPLAPTSGTVIHDFEGDDYGTWTTTGTAFGSKPSGGTGPGQQAVSGYLGGGLVNTFDPGGDNPTGILTSPDLILTEEYIYFLIGGGSHPGTTCINLVHNKQVVRTATGQNSEQLGWTIWDVSDLAGETVHLEIVDQVTGGWGHILVDQITLTSEKLTPTINQVIHDFEGGSYGDWTTTGTAFSTAPSAGTGPGQQTVSGYEGKGLVNTYDPEKDPATGTLASPEFTISDPYIYFLIGGGSYDEATCINLLVDDQVVRTATGNNTETLRLKMWNLSDLQGKSARIEIVDQATGAWGHILVDQIITSDDNLAIQELPDMGGNLNAVIQEDGHTILHMSTNRPSGDPGYGDMALLALHSLAEGTASFESLDSLLTDLQDDGVIAFHETAGPSPDGQTCDGAINTPITLQAGESETVTYALVWYFPKVTHGSGSWSYTGNMYSNWWDNALEIAETLADSLDELTAHTRLYHQSLYETNLPRYMVDRISSQAAVLTSKTCFWSAGDYFGGWEGCAEDRGLGTGICNHVWQYGQLHARLFPSVGRRMREQSLAYQQLNGGLPHRQVDEFPAFDGQCGEIIAAYREHQMSKDKQWLNAHWDRIKKAMDFTITRWDNTEDGVLSGGQWNTLDNEIGGNTSWLGTMYLTALAASEEMAKNQGDTAAATRYKTIRLAGTPAQDKALWNGEYYIQVPDATPRDDYNTGCHIDQLLGEWWAGQVSIPQHYPEERIKTTLSSIFKYNFREDFQDFTQKPRKFVDEDDAGVLMTTWPNGGRPNPAVMYADEVWTGQEYAVAAAMIDHGLLEEGFGVVLAVSDRYNGRMRTNLSAFETWGYSGNPFCDEEWGKFYARPLSVWSLLIAAQGYIYDGPAGLIGFMPKWKPEDHQSFFTAAEGWGTYSQVENATDRIHNLEIKYGELGVKTIVFQARHKIDTSLVTITAPFPVKSFHIEDGRITIELENHQTISANEEVEIIIHNIVGDELTGYSHQETTLSSYPNPFTGSTVIRYKVPEQGPLSITIHNGLGQKIATLADREETGGSGEIIWDGNDDQGAPVTTGLYIVTIDNASQKQFTKLLKTK